jgi:hypothetical protein
VLLLLWSAFAWVKPTNFGGYDEWFVVDLTSRGIIDFPYANRPYVFVWALPAALLLPHTLWGYLLLHTAYLYGSGLVLLALCRRLAPAERWLPALAAAFLVAWAPLDLHRVNAINNLFYSGVAFGTLLAILLFQESWLSRSRPLLALAAALGFVAARSYEAVIALLLFAPPLLLLGWHGGPRREVWRWLAPWEAVMSVAAVLAALPTLWPDPIGSYQIGALGMDPHPARWAARAANQIWLHVGPLFAPPGPVHALPMLLAVLACALLALGARSGEPEASPRGVRPLLRMAAFGLLLAGLGVGVLTLSRAIRGPDRVQGFSGPGVAVVLAALVSLPAALWPRRGVFLTAGLACWVAAAGTNRTLALQAEWDARGLYGVQSRVLGQILRLAPAVKPNTLIVLLDGAEAFPAAFTFRHAIRYFYAGHALGHVWGGHELFYPARIGPEGIDIEPWPRIRGPWSAPATRHAYEEIVVVRVDPAGTVSLEPRWPERLPAFPGYARYSPESRIVPAPPANPRAGLLAAGRVGATEPLADGRATIHPAWHSSRAHSGP